MVASVSRRTSTIVCLFLFCAVADTTQLFAQVPSPWAARDIGSPAVAGSVSFNQGVFTVTAGGSDIWEASDQFQFVYQQITGDVDVIARVDSVTMAHAWSKAGVMIRSSLAANAAHGFALVSAGKGVALQSRALDGGLSTSAPGSLAAPPQWIRLIRIGTKLTAYSSASGSTWTTIGSGTIALGSVAYVGLAATSHNAGASTTALLSQVAVVRLGLPASQKSTDIGAPAIKGAVSYRQGVYTVHAGGTDIWSTSDQFHFVYQQVSGDVEVVARVGSIKYADQWSKSGVMIRETLSAGSRHAMAVSSAGRGYAFQRRVNTGGFSDNTAGTAGAPPGWVRLVRIGAQIQAFQSPDGTRWTLIGSDAIPMANTVYVGIATTSHNATSATDAVVDNLRITPLGSVPNQPPLVALTAPSDGTSITAGSNLSVTAAANDGDGTVSRVDFFAGTTLLGSDTTQPYGVTWTAVPAGTYSLTAVATDNDGGRATSATVGVKVTATTTTSPPTAIAFHASADHATLVTRYELRIFASGANLSTATPIATSDLAKPVPDIYGDITVNRATLFSALAPGSYVAAVRAIGLGGSSTSVGIPFTR
jgi:regulation of enolase protein 1 (concanavalin A-like superfamily)